jgi:hypothetical protein
MYDYTRMYRPNAGGKEFCTINPYVFGITPRLDRFKKDNKFLSVPKKYNPVIETSLSTIKTASSKKIKKKVELQKSSSPIDLAITRTGSPI